MESYQKENIIIIHIPKTACTTLKNYLTQHGLTYCDLKIDNMISQPAKLINDLLDSDKKIIICWRNPIDHILSCYYHYQNIPELKTPRNINTFIDYKRLQNMQSCILLQQLFLDKHEILNINILKKLIAKPNVFCFLTNYINESFAKLNTFLDIKSNTLTPAIEFNFNKPPINFVYSKEHIQRIKTNNKFDYQIYNLIIKKYSYKNKTNYDDIVIYNPPLSFPLNWITNNDVIEKYDSTLNLVYTELFTKIPCTIKEYITMWTTRFASYNNISLDKHNNIYDNLLDLKQHL